MELPDLENLYYTILQWDYYTDLIDDEIIYNKLEDDNIYEDVLQINELEKIPIRFQNTEDYFRIFHRLFLVESRAQMSRSKQIEVLLFNID